MYAFRIQLEILRQRLIVVPDSFLVLAQSNQNVPQIIQPLLYPIILSALFILFKLPPVVLFRISKGFEFLQILIYSQPVTHLCFLALLKHFACGQRCNLVLFEDLDLHIPLYQQFSFIKCKADLFFWLN